MKVILVLVFTYRGKDNERDLLKGGNYCPFLSGFFFCCCLFFHLVPHHIHPNITAMIDWTLENPSTTRK